jgi:hypothetical protein
MREIEMATMPLTRDELVRRHPAREALRGADLPIRYRQMPLSAKPGVRVFPPPVEGKLIERPDRALLSEARRRAVERFGTGLENLGSDQLADMSREIAARLAQIGRVEAKGTDGFVPDHFPSSQSSLS